MLSHFYERSNIFCKPESHRNQHTSDPNTYIRRQSDIRHGINSGAKTTFGCTHLSLQGKKLEAVCLEKQREKLPPIHLLINAKVAKHCLPSMH